MLNSTTDIPAPKPIDTSPPGLELLLPLLCLVGLCLATYLSVLHYALLLGDLSFGRACGGGTWGDCNSVVGSRYGKLIGLPVSVWGMGYYLCAGSLSLGVVMFRKPDAAPFLPALFLLTVLALVFDGYLAWGMWRLERLCPLCLATYGINGLILLIVIRCRRKSPRADARSWSVMPSPAVLFRPAEPAYYREVLKAFLAGSAVASCLLVLGVALSVADSVTAREKDKMASLLEYLRVVKPFPLPTEGRPSRGADRLGGTDQSTGTDNAAITIVVFSDFLCEQCKLASRYLDMVAANHRDSLRLVYMHFPADTACNEHVSANMHPGACKLAQAAECAHAQGRFWAFHDAVFADAGQVRPEKIANYATRAGLNLDDFNACLTSSVGRVIDPPPAAQVIDLPSKTETAAPSLAAVQADIALGHSVGVTVTPTLYVNGRPLVGAVKPWMLEAAIEQIATSASSQVTRTAPE